MDSSGGSAPRRGGARPGAGRPSSKALQEMRELFESACPRARQVEIIQSLATAAVEGNVRAAAFLFDRIYGTPSTQITAEISGTDPIRVVFEDPTEADDDNGDGGSEPD